MRVKVHNVIHVHSLIMNIQIYNGLKICTFTLCTTPHTHTHTHTTTTPTHPHHAHTQHTCTHTTHKHTLSHTQHTHNTHTSSTYTHTHIHSHTHTHIYTHTTYTRLHTTTCTIAVSCKCRNLLSLHEPINSSNLQVQETIYRTLFSKARSLFHFTNAVVTYKMQEPAPFCTLYTHEGS